MIVHAVSNTAAPSLTGASARDAPPRTGAVHEALADAATGDTIDDGVGEPAGVRPRVDPAQAATADSTKRMGMNRCMSTS
jgi:hypothetical protein